MIELGKDYAPYDTTEMAAQFTLAQMRSGVIEFSIDSNQSVILPDCNVYKKAFSPMLADGFYKQSSNLLSAPLGQTMIKMTI